MIYLLSRLPVGWRFTFDPRPSLLTCVRVQRRPADPSIGRHGDDTAEYRKWAKTIKCYYGDPNGGGGGVRCRGGVYRFFWWCGPPDGRGGEG